MGRTVLPSGEEVSVTPREILRYAGPDAIRQILHQERMHWNLKTNKDADFLDQERLFHYASEVHNDGDNLRMEVRTFPDNGAYPGYAGVNIDSGVFGIPHSFDKWDESVSEESKEAVVNRVAIGAVADIPEKSGSGLDENGEISTGTSKRAAAILFDPYDGRAYLLSNDSTAYVNNEKRNEDTKIPGRAVARICDIPTKISQLGNNMEFISDPTFQHTDNNFTYSNRFVIDNLDDRTFVYPELSKDHSGNYIDNLRVGLNGDKTYAESDGTQTQNTQPDPNGDRNGARVSSYNANINYSDSYHLAGFLPGVFRSLEELNKVDLVNQRQTSLTHNDTPGSRRDKNYYSFDGVWTPSWYDETRTESYRKASKNPSNMEMDNEEDEPVPFSTLRSSPQFDRSQLYQWRYNRVDVIYPSSNITMRLIESGSEYEVGDILKWSFGDDVFTYEVTRVGPNGQIQAGHYVTEDEIFYDQDPDTHGIGIEFTNTSSVGHGAKISIKSVPKIVSMATQLKNNLYAYVDVTPTVRSDNTSTWSDTKLPDTQNGRIVVRSTAAGPAYSGLNSGRGGPAPSVYTSTPALYEHGGNATAGAHVHLFRYVINTQSPTWTEDENHVKVYTGKWVDQGPMGLERPCDIKALLFSNPDCNNFNNYYKFMLDLLIDTFQRNADGTSANSPNTVSIPKIHVDKKDPDEDTRFTEKRINPETGVIEDVDITDKVIYINAATGIMFIYNMTHKSDSKYGYGYRAPGWMAIAGATSR